MLCGCMGYAAFGDDAPDNLRMGFGFYEPFWLLDTAPVTDRKKGVVSHGAMCREMAPPCVAALSACSDVYECTGPEDPLRAHTAFMHPMIGTRQPVSQMDAHPVAGRWQRAHRIEGLECALRIEFAAFWCWC
jgi:hypothetical protein